MEAFTVAERQQINAWLATHPPTICPLEMPDRMEVLRRALSELRTELDAREVRRPARVSTLADPLTATLADWYRAGATLTALAEMVGFTPRAIGYRLAGAGIQRRRPGARRSKS